MRSRQISQAPSACSPRKRNSDRELTYAAMWFLAMLLMVGCQSNHGCCTKSLQLADVFPSVWDLIQPCSKCHCCTDQCSGCSQYEPYDRGCTCARAKINKMPLEKSPVETAELDEADSVVSTKVKNRRANADIPEAIVDEASTKEVIKTLGTTDSSAVAESLQPVEYIEEAPEPTGAEQLAELTQPESRHSNIRIPTDFDRPVRMKIQRRVSSAE